MERLLILLGLCLTVYGQNGMRRIGFYSNNAQFRPVGGKFFPEDIDSSLVNYMVYHNAVINNDCEIVYAEWNDADLYERFNAHKDNNDDLRTLLAVKRTQAECNIGDKSNRLTFADSAVDFLRTHGFDGLDLHFELTPVEYEGFRDDFTALLQECRAAFDGEETEEETLLLTATVSAKADIVDRHYDVPEIVEVTDWLGLKTYDFRGPGPERNVGFVYNHSPLYARSDDDEESAWLNVETAAQHWVNSGAPPEHLVIGVAALGVGFILANESFCSTPNCETSGPSTGGYYTREDGILSHYERCEMYGGDDGTLYWDEEQAVPYTISTEGSEWIGHENVDSVEIKGEWIVATGYGGWMMWTFDLDDWSGNFCELGPYPLLEALNRATR